MNKRSSVVVLQPSDSLSSLAEYQILDNASACWALTKGKPGTTCIYLPPSLPALLP